MADGVADVLPARLGARQVGLAVPGRACLAEAAEPVLVRQHGRDAIVEGGQRALVDELPGAEGRQTKAGLGHDRAAGRECRDQARDFEMVGSFGVNVEATARARGDILDRFAFVR